MIKIIQVKENKIKNFYAAYLKDKIVRQVAS